MSAKKVNELITYNKAHAIVDGEKLTSAKQTIYADEDAAFIRYKFEDGKIMTISLQHLADAKKLGHEPRWASHG